MGTHEKLHHRWDHEIRLKRDFQGTQVDRKMRSKIHIIHSQHWCQTNDNGILYRQKNEQCEKRDDADDHA